MAVFTITKAGMFMYDPGSRKIHKVQEGLDWLKASSFEKARIIALK